jgi:molybdopterin converting factor small subunit
MKKEEFRAAIRESAERTVSKGEEPTVQNVVKSLLSRYPEIVSLYRDRLFYHGLRIIVEKELAMGHLE